MHLSSVVYTLTGLSILCLFFVREIAYTTVRLNTSSRFKQYDSTLMSDFQYHFSNEQLLNVSLTFLTLQCPFEWVFTERSSCILLYVALIRESAYVQRMEIISSYQSCCHH